MTTLILALLLGSPTVDLAAVGDLMLGRYVGRRIDRYGVDSVFAGAAGELRKADITFGNLECVLSERPFAVSKRVLLRANPSSASGLKRAGFDIFSVANNHSLDAGLSGLSDTVSTLEKAGIRSIGRRRNPLVLTRNGVRVAFLAYCDIPGGPGICYSDDDRVRQDVSEARQTADAVVVSFHWGDELTNRLSERQSYLAGVAAKAGADAVLGHHPHVWQKIVWRPGLQGRQCLVAYSLGNFVFDSNQPAQRVTGILHVALSRHGALSYSVSSYRITKGTPSPIR